MKRESHLFRCNSRFKFVDKKLQETKLADRKNVEINVRTQSEIYHINEAVFTELEKEVKDIFSNEESQEKFKEKLFRYYNNECINLRELLELLGKMKLHD